MPTLNFRANTFLATTNTTWATTANAVDGAYGAATTTYAVWTNTTANATGTIDVGFGTLISSNLPAGATLTGVTLTLRSLVSQATRVPTVTFQPFDSTTAIGTPSAATSTTSVHNDGATVTPTVAQLRSSTFKIRVSATRFNGTQAGTFSIDSVDISIGYITAAPVTSFSANKSTVIQGQTVVFTNTSTGDPATSWTWNFGTGASPATASTVGPHTVTYDTQGTSTVNYTAGNAAGNQAAAPQSITVTGLSKAETLVDDFSGTLAKWAGSYGGVVIESGRAKIPCTTGYPALWTDPARYDLSNSFVLAQVTPPAGGAGGRETSMELRLDNNNKLIFLHVAGNSLRCVTVFSGTTNNQKIMTYDPVAHSWWKIHSTAANNVRWSTSPDSVTWTEQWSMTVPIAITSLDLLFACGYYGTETAANGFVDNVNSPLAPPPVASFTSSQTTIQTGQTVTFTDTTTGSPDGWNWTFPSGSPNTAITQGPHTITFPTAGSVPVSLSVIRSSDSSSDISDTTTITVNPPPPVASFTADKTSIETGQSVVYTDTSTNTPTTWAWDFGTGASPATASTKGPHTVTYATAGTSAVSLTAGNAGGSDASDLFSLTVTSPTAPTGGKPKVWSGSAWGLKPAKYWTGSAWLEKPMKRWTGSAWVLVNGAGGPAAPVGSLVNSGQGGDWIAKGWSPLRQYFYPDGANYTACTKFLPPGVSVSWPAGVLPYTWAVSTSQPSALTYHDRPGDVQCCWYQSTLVTVDVAFAQAWSGPIHVYYLSVATDDRSVKAAIALNGSEQSSLDLLASDSATWLGSGMVFTSMLPGGRWLSWDVNMAPGDMLTLSSAFLGGGGGNAVLSAIVFG